MEKKTMGFDFNYYILILCLHLVITFCFFIQNIYARFQMLNDVWKCLPAGLVTVSSQWTLN
ncbi:Gustatory receptor, partial [Aphis craccivora]